MSMDADGESALRHIVKAPTDSPYRKFRRIARMVAHSVHFVKFLARILKNPIEWSWEYDPKTYSEEEVAIHSTAIPSSESKLKGHAPNIPLLMSREIFGVSHLFSKPRKFQGWLESDMRARFRKKPHMRTKTDLDLMVTWCSTMKCMEKYPTSIQRALLGAAIYTRWNSSRQVFKESHPVGRFYIILDGEVEISKIDRAKVILARNKSSALASLITTRRTTVVSDHRMSTHQEEENLEAALAARRASLEGLAAGEVRESILDGEAEEDAREAKAAKQAEDDLNKAYTVTMGYMGAGESFDIAFLTSTVRASTYTTNRMTEFLTISKRDYELIMSHYKEAESAKQDMLRTHPVFRTLNGDVASLGPCTVIKKYDANRAIVCQGQHSSSIYFIVSGTCRVVQSVDFVKRDVDKRTFQVLRVSDVELHSPTPSNPQSPGVGPDGSVSRHDLTATTSSTSNVLSDHRSGAGSSKAAPVRVLPKRCRLITELLVVRNLAAGDFFGQSMGMLVGVAASATSSTGGSVQQHTSIVSNDKVAVVAISKLDFHRLATDATWRLLREDAARYPLGPQIEAAYLDKRTWNVAKKRIIGEILRIKRAKEGSRMARDPYGKSLAWAV